MLLAHFSDFHLTRHHAEYNRALALVEDAIEQGTDHIAITGDIVESQEMDVLEDFIEALDGIGWSDSSRLSIVPGNHDVFWPLQRNTHKEFCGITRCSRKGRFSRSLFSDTVFPFGKNLSDNVVVAGIDTTRNENVNPFCAAEGELCEEDIDVVHAFMNDNIDAKHRILMMHHYPFDEQYDWNIAINQNFSRPTSDVVRNWLRFTGATIVLCGHSHIFRTRKLSSKCQLFSAYSQADHNEERGYLFLNLKRNGEVNVVERRFSNDELDEMVEENWA